MLDKKDIWNQVAEILQLKLSKSEYDIWFSHIRLKQLDSNLALIEVPNKFHADWLQERYLPEIQKSFDKIIPYSPNIAFFYHPPLTSAEGTSTEMASRKIIDQIPEKRPPDRHNIKVLGDILDPNMTFQRFIPAEFNRFAFTSSIEVADRPANQYNPLYIFSRRSLGKTHLLHAIGHHFLNTRPHHNVRYLSSNSFISDFSRSARSRSLQELRDRYHHIDLLLFDDVQLLSNRKRTQEEFLFLFNHLYGMKKQMVITGNHSPNQLSHMNPQLISRLEWGLLCEIRDPDLDTKIDIIKRKSKEYNLSIPDDVIFYIVKRNNDLKNIFRSLARLQTYSSLNKKEISISLMKSLFKEKNKLPEIEEIKSVVAAFFDISISDLTSSKRNRSYSYPRHLAMYLCRKYTNLSFKEIGESFGNKNHSTVIHAIDQIEKKIKQKKDILSHLIKIEELLT
ncbi:MAG: chromosomal replication initiator protein DnaA [Pseudomonadota bacterium]